MHGGGLAKRIAQVAIEMVFLRVIYSQYDSAILNLLLASHIQIHQVQFIFTDEISSQMLSEKLQLV